MISGSFAERDAQFKGFYASSPPWKMPPQSQVSFRKRVTKYRALLRKMTYKIKLPMGLWHPLLSHTAPGEMTHSCVWHYLSICVTWPNSYGWHDSFISDCILTYVSDTTYSYAWHDWTISKKLCEIHVSFIHVIGLIYFPQENWHGTCESFDRRIDMEHASPSVLAQYDICEWGELTWNMWVLRYDIFECIDMVYASDTSSQIRESGHSHSYMHMWVLE